MENKIQDMTAVILAGGLGTRLREETEFKPKPMVEIGGKPILWHIMKHYSTFGVSKFLICGGYKIEHIKNFFLNYSALQNDFTVELGSNKTIKCFGKSAEEHWEVTVADTGSNTMTGGRVNRIEKYLQEGDFFLTYGDGLSNVDLRSLYEFHITHGKIATLTSVQPASRFGILELAENGAVKSFNEKPQLTGWINAGFFVFKKDIFKYLDDEVVLEREPLEKLSKDNELMAYKHRGFWQPMDTYRETTLLNELWDEHKAPWKSWV